jgi:hypothetical protein
MAANIFEAVSKPSSFGLTMSSVLNIEVVMVNYGKEEASQGGEEEERPWNGGKDREGG